MRIKKIARLPVDDGSGKDEYCSVCSDDTVVLVIDGKHRLSALGLLPIVPPNQINLCSRCCANMKRQMNEINDGLNIPV